MSEVNEMNLKSSDIKSYREILTEVPYSSFNYWFMRTGKDTFSVINASDGEHIKSIKRSRTSTGDVLSIENQYTCAIPLSEAQLEGIQEDFERYKQRPEYLVGENVPAGEHIKVDEVLYENLLVGTALVRSKFRDIKINPDDAVPKIDNCISWLHSTDFFDAPGSSVYHDNYRGGLLQHTLRVARNIMNLVEIRPFSNRVRYEDALLCALVHDWCKIDQYESYYKKLPNPETGNWEPVLCWKRKESMMPLGHGVSSLFLAMKFFKLSTEEAHAIRWHMGPWRCCESDMDELQQANETFPLVHLLQFADQLAITKYGM